MMKSQLLVLFSLLLFNNLSGQASLSEDFEAYNNGDLITIISEDWKLWPKGTDTPVTTEQAASGKNALKLVGGKNTDIYFPFKRRFTAGAIQFSMDIYIPAGNNGYFNFQGEELPGKVWSMQCYLDNKGMLQMVDDGITKLNNVYPQGQWFTMSIDINLENHLWRFYINGNCVGSYVQDKVTRQSIASLALYSSADDTDFYVDNISFEHQGIAKTLTFTNDAAIKELKDATPGLPSIATTSFAGINGTEQALECLIMNTGQENISSIELAVEAAEETVTQKIQLDLAKGADTTVTITKKLIYKDSSSAKISLTKINGLTDENRCNNSTPLHLHGYTLHPDKKVWIEEATGTWCPWCPRGEVYMDYISKKYPEHFVGIAVHYNDPMELLPWIDKEASRRKRAANSSTENEEILGLQTYVTGFPSAYIDRTEVIDPSKMEQVFLKKASQAPLATLAHSAKWDAQSRQLEVIITTALSATIPEDMKLIVGLTENGLSGEGKRWSQVNMYSGGAHGQMGGYELLPAKVPDSLMVYNHVAKFLLTPFEGEAMQRSASQPEETRVIRTFTQRIPGDSNIENMHIVSGLVIGDSGVHNANKTTIHEALNKEDPRKGK